MAKVPARAVQRFIDRLEAGGLCMHGFLVMQGGEVAAEGYWAPFTADSPHRMYSVSKSITALAVGLLMDEGALRLEDTVAPFFPEKLPDYLHPYLRRTTVRHLLMMAAPHAQTTYTAQDRDWVRTFFHTPPTHPPGSVFSYNTAATVVLAALVERITGRPMLDYMRPRLLGPMGISDSIRCIQTPEEGSWGGSGVICTLRDMVKFARLCVQGGRWEGRQLISNGFIRQATSRQIACFSPGLTGYGFQIWCLPEQGFLFCGMGLQMAYCFPDKDLIVACTADTQMMGKEAEAILRTSVYEELLPAVRDNVRPDTTAEREALEARLSSLAMKPVAGEAHSVMVSRVNGQRYQMRENSMGIDALTLTFDGSHGMLVYEKEGETRRIDFGIHSFAQGIFPETYDGMRIGVPDRRYRYLASAAWVEMHKLCLLIHITDDYLGALRVEFSFLGEEVSVHMVKAAEWFLEDYQGFAGGWAAK